MKQTHNNYYQEQAEIERISELLEARKQFEEKTRINLYLPKIIVKLIDRLAKDVSRGELVTALVIKELKKKEKLPFGMFSPIWYFTGQKTLSSKAKRILDEVFLGKYACFIPAIVLLETFHISLKIKKFIFPGFIKKLRLTNVIIVPLDKVILDQCYKLPKNLDIHDRIILATAMVNKCVLLTKDKELKQVSRSKTLW